MIKSLFNRKNRGNWLLLALIIFLIYSTFKLGKGGDTNSGDALISEDGNRDLSEILEEGKLRVLIDNSTTSFFNYKGQSMGFEYEILEKYAAELDVELELVFIESLENVEDRLNAHEGDLIACNFTQTKERKKKVDFSVPYFYAKQVLIQRYPDNWEDLSKEELARQMIQDPMQLAQKKVFINKFSSYYTRLNHLSEEIGDTIFVQTDYSDFSNEELIELVAEGTIDYTVAEDNVAELNKRFYDNISVDLALSSNQKIAFGIRHSSSELKEHLNAWLREFMKTSQFQYIEHKYFISQKFTNISSQVSTTIPRGNISPYDEYFKKSAKKHQVDWRLVAAIAFQESRFNPNPNSFGGAYGMMQFMPGTGERYGVYRDSPPNVQIEGGSKKVKGDIDRWSQVPDMDQRIKFALATYNAGLTHILDAQKLAEKHHLNPLKWDDNVDIMVKNLSKREFYRDPVVKGGAMRGDHTSNYVRSIYKRYLSYKQTNP